MACCAPPCGRLASLSSVEGRDLAAEVRRGETSYALRDDVGLLAEGPADELATGLGVVVEALRRDGDDPGALGQGEAQLAAVGPAEVRHVGGREVGALRHARLEAGLGEPVAQQVAPRLQVA